MTLFNEGTGIDCDLLLKDDGSLMSTDEVLAAHRLREFTQSSLTTASRCEVRFFLRYVLGIRLKAFNRHFFVGNLIHDAFEGILPQVIGKPIREWDASILVEALRKMDQTTVELVDSSVFTERDLQHVKYGLAQARAMLRGWFLNPPVILEGFTCLATEQNVRAAPGATSLPQAAAGKLDGVLADANGDLWLLEHKSRSRLDTLDVHNLRLNFQANFYLAMGVLRMRSFLTEAGYDLAGRQWRGFVYNVIKKPQHRVNKKTYDYAELEDRMVDAICKDPDAYFVCDPVHTNARDVQFAMRDATIIADRIAKMSAATILRDTTACDDYSGCEFKPLCLEGADISNLSTVINNVNIGWYEGAAEHEELTDE